MTAPGLPIVWKERPFDGAVRRRILEVTPRMPTVAEIVASIPAHELPRGFAEFGEIRINDESVPRGCWHLVRPRYRPGPAGTIVSLHMPLRGGGGGSGSDGGGGKSILTAIATIAVLLVAAAVTGGALGGLLGASFAAGSVGASVAGAAVGIVGSLAIAALTPPPSLAATSTDSSAASSVTSSSGSTTPSAASLSGNLLAPGAPMPRVVGTRRVYPPLLCNPLIELVGDTEVGEAVFGLAGPHRLLDVRVGDAATDSITNVRTQLVEGKSGDAIQDLVQRQSFTLSVTAELSGHALDETTQYQLADQGNPAANLPQPQAFVTRKAPDEVWITHQWPEGLFAEDDTTATINQALRIQIRRRGTDAFINLPEVHFSQNQPGAFQKVVRLKWGPMPLAKNPPPSNQGPVYVFKHVPGQDGSTIVPASADWIAHASFSAGSGDDVLSSATFLTSRVQNAELYNDKVIFYLDPAVFPQDYYEIQVLRSMPYRNAGFVPASYTYGGNVIDFFYYYLIGGVARITIDHAPFHDRVVVPRISSIWNQNPIQSRDFATISVKVNSRALEQLSVLASGYVRDWDGDGWNALTTTSNPAPHLRDVMTGNLGASPLPEELLNDDELIAWRSSCIDNGYTVNAVLEGKTYNDAMTLIAAAGYARVRQNERWGVFEDRDVVGESPVQIFTPRNMTGFKWTRAFAKLPSGFRATFNNIDDNYQADQVIVYADPGNQDANNLETMPYDALVDIDDVIKRAKFDLAQAKGRFTFYQGETDLESLVCQRGDLVAVQHDILVKQAGFSRIKAVLKSGDIVTGLDLDGSVPVNAVPGIFATAHLFTTEHIFELGQRTGVSIRLKGGSGILIQEVTADSNGHVKTISFVTPFDDPGEDLDIDCLVTTGPLDQEFKRLLVFGIQPSEDFRATMIFVDEAPQIWDRALLIDGDGYTYIDVGDGSLLRAA